MVEDIARRALVLSGGGGRGAYHVGVLARLEQVGWQPHMIIGTSIGAVNAVALGSGINVDGLRERWLDLETSDVQKMRADDVFVDNMLIRRTHIFDTTPLLSTLRGSARKWRERPWIVPDILNGQTSPYDVWITAVDADTRELVTFYNKDDDGLTARMVQASCSIPLWYEPTVIDGRTYIDGGTIANTPFRKALEEGATEIVVVMMVPRPDRPLKSWTPSRTLPPPPQDLLRIPQALWSAFEPALDMLLGEIFWKDYRLLQAELQMGLHPQLEWIRFITPDEPLPLGNMTIYNRQNHIALFEMGERDTHKVLDSYM